MNDFRPFLLALGLIGLTICSERSARAWGRHDLITEMAISTPQFKALRSVQLRPETIEHAAPDLIRRVIPEVEQWCVRYHRDYDSRYTWSIPDEQSLASSIGRPLSSREKLLWALEDNFNTPLVAGKETLSGQVLIRYVDEPDTGLDSELGQAPYLDRLRDSMSYFYERQNPHTDTFRHYYVPSSMIPPILSPKGVAPYRAGLYAQLSAGAFKTGHPYWGYRFLAWSLHYIQDVTQPWHTVFLPNISFLKWSRQDMKHEISALHFLTEAFVDTWLGNIHDGRLEPTALPQRNLAEVPKSTHGPWLVTEATEHLARLAHQKASHIADLARSFFDPIVRGLGPDLKPQVRTIGLGGLQFISAKLDFSGNGKGATEFLAPLWNAQFASNNSSTKKQRDELLQLLIAQVDAAVEGTRLILSAVQPSQ